MTRLALASMLCLTAVAVAQQRPPARPPIANPFPQAGAPKPNIPPSQPGKGALPQAPGSGTYLPQGKATTGSAYVGVVVRNNTGVTQKVRFKVVGEEFQAYTLPQGGTVTRVVELAKVNNNPWCFNLTYATGIGHAGVVKSQALKGDAMAAPTGAGAKVYSMERATDAMKRGIVELKW